MAPGQQPGGPFNPLNRGRLLKGTGRGSLQLRNTHGSSQLHFGRKPKNLSAVLPQTAFTEAKFLRPSGHDPLCWHPDSELVQSLRTSFGATSTSSPLTRSDQLPSHRPSASDRGFAEISLLDDPLGFETIANEGFLDACFESASYSGSDASSTVEHRFIAAPARLPLPESGDVVQPQPIKQNSCTYDEDITSTISNDASTAPVHSTSVSVRRSTDQSPSLSESATNSSYHWDSSSSSSSRPEASSFTSSFRSILDSYPANVVVSMLCPRALSGHLIGRSGQTAAALQLPGARWWLTDKAWKFGGASNLRLMMIQGQPAAVANVLAKVMSHITSDAAPRNSQFFKTRQGLLKAKIVLQSWLIGTVVGKGGSTIRRIMLESGAQMQVTSVLTAVNAQKKPTAPRQLDEEAVLQIAAPSISALATCVRLTFEVIRKNPCYKPVTFKSASDYKQLSIA